MSQQVSLNQLLKKTEHYDKVCAILDTVVADFGGGTAGGAVPDRGMKARRQAREAAGTGSPASIYYPFNCMFWVT